MPAPSATPAPARKPMPGGFRTWRIRSSRRPTGTDSRRACASRTVARSSRRRSSTRSRRPNRSASATWTGSSDSCGSTRCSPRYMVAPSRKPSAGPSRRSSRPCGRLSSLCTERVIDDGEAVVNQEVSGPTADGPRSHPLLAHQPEPRHAGRLRDRHRDRRRRHHRAQAAGGESGNAHPVRRRRPLGIRRDTRPLHRRSPGPGGAHCPSRSLRARSRCRQGRGDRAGGEDPRHRQVVDSVGDPLAVRVA